MFKKNLIRFPSILLLCLAVYLISCTEAKTKGDNSILPMLPTLKEKQESSLQALLTGVLVLDGACLRVGEKMIIWPKGFTLSSKGGVISVYNNENSLVSSVGDSIELSGGVTNDLSHLEGKLEGFKNGICVGPYWIAGEQ